MQKRLMVHRIFPLGDYKNVQFVNETLVEDADNFGPEEVNKLYDEMIVEIYQAFFQHAELAMSFEAAKTIGDKREAFKNYLDQKGEN